MDTNEPIKTIIDNFDILDPQALMAVGHFFLNGVVKEESAFRLTQQLLRMADVFYSLEEKPTFTININSPGGILDDCLMLLGTINHVKNMGFQVDTYVKGDASSAAFIISQMGDIRYADLFSSYMMHDVQGGSIYSNTEDKKNRLGILEKQRLIIAKIISGRNTNPKYNKPAWWLKNVMKNGERYWTADEAMKFGLVDYVIGEYPSPKPIKEREEDVNGAVINDVSDINETRLPTII